MLAYEGSTLNSCVVFGFLCFVLFIYFFPHECLHTAPTREVRVTQGEINAGGTLLNLTAHTKKCPDKILDVKLNGN